MSQTRTVTATAPDNSVATRTSKTKVYTHAVAIYRPAVEGYTIPAGTYTVPKQRIRGHNVAAYQTTVSEDIIVAAQPESYGILSFHTSEVAARKAGQSEVNAYAKNAIEERAIYGVNASVRVTSFRAIPVDVVDEGFNA